MSGIHVGARVSEELADALETAARKAETSKSELIRQYLTESVLDSEEPIPDHLRQELRRERLKRQNRLTWQRIHFPSNVAERFRRAFEQGDLDSDLNPGAVEDIRDIYVEDAKILFEDDAERREAAVEYVEALADHAREATDASEFDRLDPEEMFEEYAGVEDGRSRADLDDVVEDARSRLDGAGQPRDSDALARALSKKHDVSEDLAHEAVDLAVTDTLDGEGGV